MRLNIDCDLVKQLVSGQLPNKSLHLNELTREPAICSCDTGQWLSCFDSCQLTILWMSNIRDVDLPRHAWDTTPSLLIVSPTPPLQSVDAYVRTYVRTYARSITWQPNEKRLTIFHEYAALSNAHFARVEARLKNVSSLLRDSGFQVPDSILSQWNFRIQIASGIPDFSFQIPDSGFHKPNFPRFRMPQEKISWIPKSGFPYMGQLRKTG